LPKKEIKRKRMIVIGRLQITEDGELLIPPFHTGHLGLIPGFGRLPDTEIHVSLNSAFDRSPTDCEVVFSPYPQSEGDMMQLTCTMRDEPGVVSRLVSAISDIGVNIATLQTSTINKLDHHFVNMILDWSTASRKLSTPSAPSVQQNFQDYRELLPIGEERYIRLFVSILARCGDVLAWEEYGGKQLPRLRLRPFEHVHGNWLPDQIRISRADTPFHAKVKCPPKVLFNLKAQLGINNDQGHSEKMHYVLLSETGDGTLRAFFPSPERVPKLIHIGFLHDDRPNALHALTEMVATSRFNIVTSLLRKQTRQRSAWETLLEYRGQDEVPAAGGGSSIYQWACDQFLKTISTDAGLAERLRRFNVECGPPSYPRPKKEQSYININSQLSTTSTSAAADQARKPPSDDALLARQIEALDSENAGVDEPRRKLVEIARRHGDTVKPRIFLSYPRDVFTGSELTHGALLRAVLQTEYDVATYQTADGELIVDRVVELIRQADFFIGIWHHEFILPNGKYGLSPWMHFEYGIAIAERKPSIIVHSERLDEKIWKRVNAGVAHPEYSDVLFESRTINMIKEYCRRHVQPTAARKAGSRG
jgi:hypothetical protein